MSQFTQYILFPVLVGIVGGFVMHWLKIRMQRTALEQLLVSEINLILRQAKDYHAYFSGDEHDWLKEGRTLDESPVFIPARIHVFKSVLPQIYLLSPKQIQKVLSFYNHHENCETLIEILFMRIQQMEKSGKALTEQKAALTKTRKDRIVNGLNSLLQITNLQIHKISNLPDSYQFQSAEETKAKMQKLFEENK